MGKLGKNAPALLMHRIAERPVAGNDVVVKVPQAVFVNAQQPGFVYRGAAGDLKADAVLCIVTVIGDVLLAGLVVLGKARNVRRDQYPVTDLDRSDIKRRQQIGVSAQKSVPVISQTGGNRPRFSSS